MAVVDDTPAEEPNDRQSSLLRRAIQISLLINLYIVLTDALLAPLHARGFAQAFFGYANGLSSVLQLPGFVAAIVLHVRSEHHTTPAAWLVILPVNLIAWLVAAAIVQKLLARGGAGERSDQSPEGRDDRRRDGAATTSPRPTRRRVIATITGAALATVTGLTGYSLLFEPRWFNITRRTFHLRGLPRELDGFRIAQVTDIHHGPWLALSYVREVVDATNALGADLIALTGDYVHRAPAYIEPVVAELARLRAPSGVVAILGNHDWWEDGPRTQLALRAAGVPLLDNTRRFLTRDRRLVEHPMDDARLCLAGVGDYYCDRQQYDQALDDVPHEMPRLLLSHNPDVAEDRRFLAGGYRVDLMLSGHTHGGQIWVPGLGTPIVPSRYGQKYAYGVVRGPACPVHVCSGIGMSVLPLRLRVRPEIALLEFRSSDGKADEAR